MKKLLAILLAMALGLIGAAFAEETEGRTINCGIEDGAYVIRLTLNEGEDGWKADDMAQDDSIVKLDSAAIEDGCFVARYAATGDGEVSVGIRHFDGIACDATYTWDLTVKDGAVTECTGGSATQSPDEAEQDPAVSGEWIQAEGSGEMTIAKNEGKGWNVTILTPGEGGAMEFTANIFYDCELDELVYEDGRFVKVPVTDGEAAEGEEIESGVMGNFTFAGENEDDARLSWYSSLSPEETIEFVRPAGGKTVAPQPEEINLTEGTYAVAFDRAKIADGVMNEVSFYTVDTYDIVDIATLEAGDTIVIDGKPVVIETLGKDEYGDLMINGGGLEAEGYDLRAYDEDNCWKIVGDDDFNTYTAQIVTNLDLADDVTFTDSWDIEKEPETFTGIEAVTKAIAESANEYFDQFNTTLRLEGDKVVEITRVYNP